MQAVHLFHQGRIICTYIHKKKDLDYTRCNLSITYDEENCQTNDISSE